MPLPPTFANASSATSSVESLKVSLTIREVQEAFGFAAVESARQHLKALVEAGELLQVSGRSRGYGLPKQRHIKRRALPILGAVQAGDLTTALEDPEGFLELPVRNIHDEHFLLRVEGESMINAGFILAICCWCVAPRSPKRSDRRGDDR